MHLCSRLQQLHAPCGRVFWYNKTFLKPVASKFWAPIVIMRRQKWSYLCCFHRGLLARCTLRWLRRARTGDRRPPPSAVCLASPRTASCLLKQRAHTVWNTFIPPASHLTPHTAFWPVATIQKNRELLFWCGPFSSWSGVAAVIVPRAKSVHFNLADNWVQPLFWKTCAGLRWWECAAVLRALRQWQKSRLLRDCSRTDSTRLFTTADLEFYRVWAIYIRLCPKTMITFCWFNISTIILCSHRWIT